MFCDWLAEIQGLHVTCSRTTHIPFFTLPLSSLPLSLLQYKETSRGPFKYSTLPCINDPNTPQIVNNDMLCPRDNFSIRTQICSTKLTQNGKGSSPLHAYFVYQILVCTHSMAQSFEVVVVFSVM